MPFKLILGDVRLFSNVWSENTALFERLMEIHSNSPKLYYGFKCILYYTVYYITVLQVHYDLHNHQVIL